MLSFITRGFALPKDISLKGNKIFNQEYIITAAGIDTIPKEKFTFENIANAITQLYAINGYTYASVTLVSETFSKITLYIDEGRLNRIIFKNLNTYYILRVQYDFNIPHRIYHKETIEKEVQKLIKKYHFKDIKVVVQPSRDYTKSFFQISRLTDPFFESKLPLIPTIEKSPDPKYDLILFIIPHSIEKTGGFIYGFNTSYSYGFIPYIWYIHPNLFQQNDNFKIGIKTGYMYAFYGSFTTMPDFKSPPRNTFNEMNIIYQSKPFFNNLFLPRISSQIYNSKAGRPDIELWVYNYVRTNVILQPGFIPAHNLKVSPLFGIEKIFILDAVSTSKVYDVSKQPEIWNFVGITADIDYVPYTSEEITKRYIILSYRYYFKYGKHFNNIMINSQFKFDFRNNDILLFIADYTYFNDPIPFYYEIPVSARSFKGLMKQNFYTTHIARVSNEYQISLYRDFIYTGVYFDATMFKGMYITRNAQGAIAYGLSLYYIFLEQFEFSLWWGKDLLFSTEESGYNLKFSLSKKW